MYEKNIFHYRNFKKYKPGNFQCLQGYPTNNPIIIAVDWSSFNFIRRSNGACLFCSDHPSSYELGFCISREIWILYSHEDDLNKALELGRATQYVGADKVFVIAINSTLLKETTHASR